jgi:O-antigen ligase
MVLCLVALALILPYASNGTVIVFAVFALGALTLKAPVQEVLEAAIHRNVLTALQIILLSAISAVWSENAGISLNMTGRLLMLLGLLLAAMAFLRALVPYYRIFTAVLAGSFTLMLVAYWIDIETGGMLMDLIKGSGKPIVKIARGGTVFTLMLFPFLGLLVLALLRPLGKAAFVLAAVFLLAAFATVQSLFVSSTPLALLIGVLGLGMALLLRRWAVWLVLALLAVLMIAMPWATSNLKAPLQQGVVSQWRASQPNNAPWAQAWEHRLYIWQFVGEKALRRPILGHGMDTARIEGGREKDRLLNPQAPEDQHFYGSRLPLHPHNGVLHIWYELGAVGIAFVLVLFAGICRHIAHTVQWNRWIGGLQLASFSSFCVFFLVSFGVWQNWWMAGVGMAFVFHILLEAVARCLQKQGHAQPSGGMPL